MKHLVFCALATLAAVPCVANPNSGAPSYSDEAIYNSLPASSEIVIGRDMTGNPVYQRSSGEIYCTARMTMVGSHSARAYSCVRMEAPDYPMPQTPSAP